MKTIKGIIIGLGLFALLVILQADLSAQTLQSDSIVQMTAEAQGLTLVAPEDLPPCGTFWEVMPGGGMAPLPCPLLESNYPTYAITDNIFLVDATDGQVAVRGLHGMAMTSDMVQSALETQATAVVNLISQVQDAELNSEMSALFSMDDEGPPSPGDGGDDGTNDFTPDGSGFALPDYGTNLWIAQVSITNGFLAGIGTNTETDIQYEIQSRTNLLQTDWQSEGFILGSELTNWTPLSVPQSGRTNLFIRLKSWADDGSGLPIWWQQQYFGTAGVDPYGDPAGDGYSNLYKFQHGLDPNQFYTPPAPQGLTASYNTSNHLATFGWLPSPGPVTGYILQITDFQTHQTTNYSLSASTTSFQEIVDDAPYNTDDSGPTIYVSAQVQASYIPTNSSWSDSAWLEDANAGGYGFVISSVNVVAGTQGSAYLVINSPLPASIVTLRLSKYDRYLEDFVSSVSPLVTNYDIPVAAFTNGIFQLPSGWIDPQADAYGDAWYDWWTQSIDAEGHYKIIGKLIPLDGDWNGYYVSETGGTNWLVPPYIDGRTQLKQNLRFLLREPYANSPFYYQEVDADGYLKGNYAASTNYVYASFHNSAPMLFGEGTGFNVYSPFEDNYRYRNFIFNLTGTDSGGNPATGVRLFEYDIDDTLMILFEPPLFQVPSFPATSGATMADLLATNDTRWLATSADISDMGIATSFDEDYTHIFYSMTNGIRNFFGLPYLSAKIAWGNTSDDTAVLSAGTTVEDVGGVFYPETAQPQFQTAEYDFWSPNTDPLPGNSAFSPTNASRQFFMSAGSQIRIAGYAKLAVLNGYSGVYGYLGQYFDQAYKITNGIATTNTTGILSSYGDFLATEPGPVALVTMPDPETEERGTCMVNVISMNTDNNRDGVMDLTFNGADSGTLTFWANNGHIEPANSSQPDHDVQVSANFSPNYAAGKITCQRDLENFARLWICGMPSLPAAQGYSVTLTCNTLSGSPAINLYYAETNGGTSYLTDTNIAQNLVNETQLGTIAAGSAYTFPDNFFTNNVNKYFLFEGAGIGAGQFMLTIYQNGNAIARTSAYIDLHDIKDLYEQAHIAGLTNSFPAMIDSTNASTFVSDHELAQNSNEAKQLVVFVHGWRMGIFDYGDFSDTMFKRLYWQGYNGRFASLRWPTLSADDFLVLGDLLSYTTYNRSEYIAHRSADGASAYFDWLKSHLPDYSINVAAHSMGNIVMMDTLKLQLAEGHTNIDNYVMMQAAVPAHCYDTNLPDYGLFTSAENATITSHTPDVYRGFPGNIAAAVNGSIVNFFNTNDFALATGTFLTQNISWEGNQLTYKPDAQWNYSSDGTNCSEFTGVGYRTVTDPREQMAFVARPRSKAVGAQSDVGGVVFTVGQVDLTAQYNFQNASTEHSAEFKWNIQQLGSTNGFYHRLGISLGVFHLVTP